MSAFFLAIVLAAAAVMLSFHRKADVSLSVFVESSNLTLLGASAAGYALSQLVMWGLTSTWHVAISTGIGLIVFAAVLGPAAWRHSMRHKLFEWVAVGLRPAKQGSAS